MKTTIRDWKIIHGEVLEGLRTLNQGTTKPEKGEENERYRVRDGQEAKIKLWPSQQYFCFNNGSIPTKEMDTFSI